MKRCMECSCPIDNDYMDEHCPGCGAPIISEEIIEEFLEEDGVMLNNFDEDDDFDDEQILEELDDEDEDDDFDGEDLDEDDEDD